MESGGRRFGAATAAAAIYLILVEKGDKMRAKGRFSVLLTVLLIAAIWTAPSASKADVTGWQTQTLPNLEPGVAYTLSDIKALSGSEAWISGGLSSGEAVVIKTLDGGTWNLMFRKGDNTDPWQRFRAFDRLSVVDSSNAWAAGSFGLTAFTTDGGSTWSHEGSPCTPGPNPDPGGTIMHNLGLKALSPTNVWVTGWNMADAGLIWHRPYTGNCSDWGYWPYRQEAGYGHANVLAIDAADAANAWAVYWNGIVHTTDGGNTWNSEIATPAGQLADIVAVSPGVAWAVGAGGMILRTDDGGANWLVQGSGVVESLRKISAVSADVAWVVGDNGTILKTVNGGLIWRSQVTGMSGADPKVNFVGVAAFDADTAWAISDQQTVFHVTDGGVYLPPSAPGVRSLSPMGVPVTGGTGPVSVYGRNFLPGARVSFGGVPAAGVTFRDSGWLEVTAPAHAAGIVDVTVVNPDGQTAMRAKSFAFADTHPQIVALSPSYGYLSTTVELDIDGAGLTPTESATDPLPTVSINGKTASVSYAGYSYVHVVFDRSLLANAGLATVTVTTAGGTSNTLEFAINYGAVSVNKPGPPAPPNQTVTVPSLSGAVQATFYGLNSSGSVMVGNVFDPPEWAGGNNSPPPAGYSFLPSYYYAVTTTDMHYQAATICFPYSDADLTAAGLDDSKLRLLRYSANSNSWEDVTFTLDKVNNVICGTSAEPMTYLALAQGPLPVPPPVVTGVAPAFGPAAGGTTVTISGRLFVPNSTVTFGGAAATNVTVVNGMKITATIPAHALGFADVVVTSPDSQTSTLAGGFEYVVPPTVTSVTPDRGRQSGSTAITITGTGFRSGIGGIVTVGGAQLSFFTVVNDTTITANAPPHAPGLVDVVVTNPDGQSGTLVNGFTYVPAPTVTNVEPNAGPVEGGTPVTIIGAGFQTGATVKFDWNMSATSVVVVSSTVITAVTPAHSAGAVYVTVANPDTQSYNSFQGFTYGKSPSIITWANPASIASGTALDGAQLNATANVTGTFVYSPAAGTTPAPGTRVLSVTFTPTDTAAYTTSTKTVNLMVLVKGDVNGDGIVDLQDAIVVLQVLSASSSLPASITPADVNGDGRIGLADAIFILQKVAGMR